MIEDLAIPAIENSKNLTAQVVNSAEIKDEEQGHDGI